MTHLGRAALKSSHQIKEFIHPKQCLASHKFFSTEASNNGFASSEDRFQAPPSGFVYGKLTNITKHTAKSDIINLLEGCNLNPKDLRVEYSRSYLPMSMLVEFSSHSAYDAAFKAIIKKGRLFNMTRADKSQWDINSPYDGKAILLHGIPRNALIDDIERFLSGCQYDSSSIQILNRTTDQGPVRMALVRFPSQALATHAYITKNRGFCLNNQINLQLLH